MASPVLSLTKTLSIGGDSPLLFIAGPCVLESEDLALEVAEELARAAAEEGLSLVFKASFDKANRTSLSSFRGPGLEEGLSILSRVRSQSGLAVLSDIHEPSQAEAAADVLDVLQIPAFLCRQTDLLVAAGRTGKPVNVKKGQFVSPWDMGHALEKVKHGGSNRVILTERGTSFGYNNLVADMRSIPAMQALGAPVVFDATHSVQLPGGQGNRSGGMAEMIPPLARAAVAAGADGVFAEVHPSPEQAKSDGPNSLPLNSFRDFARSLLSIRAAREA